MTYLDDIWYVGEARSEVAMLNFGRGREWRSQGLPGWATRPPGEPK